jgi:hypothetical protein
MAIQQKLNLYKFVKAPSITSDSLKNAGPLGKSLVQSQKAQLSALNNIGSALNNIGGTLKGIYNIELKRLKREQKELKESFTPKFTKGQGLKAPGFKSAFKGIKVKGFWEGLLQMLGGLLKFLIIRPILEYLADPKNQQRIKDTLETFKKVFVWIYQFTQSRIIGIVDGLYDFFNEDNTWQERLGGFMRGFGNLGVLLLGLRWLSNPLRIITDLRSVLTFFYNRLLGAKKRLNAPVGSTVGGRRTGGGRVRGAVKGAAGVTGVALLGAYGIGRWLEWQEEQNEKGDAVDENQQNTIDGLSTSVEQLVDQFEQGYLDAIDPQGKSRGGSVRRRSNRRRGGYISGPQSGYPVSLNGRGVDFIGHGTEYVAQKPGGDAFVVPLDTPHTRRDPKLTDKRITQAMGKGYDFSRGGEVQYKPQGGWITGPMSGYPVSVKGRNRPDFIAHGTEYISKGSSGDYGVIPFHKGVSKAYTKTLAQMTALTGGSVPNKKPTRSDFRSGSGYGSRNAAPQAFLGKVFSGIGNAVKGIFGGGGSSGGSSGGGGGGGGFLSGIGNAISGLFGGNKKKESPYTFGPLASGDQYGSMLAGNKIFGFDYDEKGSLKGSTFLPGILSQGPGIGRTIGKIFGNESLGGSIGGLLKNFGGVMGKQEGFNIGSLIQSGLGVAGHFFKDKKGILGQIGKYAGIFTGPNADKFTFGEKLVMAAKLALEGNSNAKYIEPIADMLGVNIDNVSALAGQSGIGTGGISSPFDIPGNSAFDNGQNVGVVGGGVRAAIDLGKWALNKGMTVMGHPNFRNNKWSEFGANTGVGYSSAGREYIGNPPKGSMRSMGLSLDVKDYRGDEGGLGRLASLAAEAYGNRTGYKISTIAHDGWGYWTAGQKKESPGSFGHPDSVFLGVAREAQQGGGQGIEEGAMQSSAISSLIGSSSGMSYEEKLLAARAKINQASMQDGALKDTDWMTSINELFSQPVGSESERNDLLGIFQQAADTDYVANLLRDMGGDAEGVNRAMNATSFGTNDALKNAFSLSSDSRYSFGTDGNNLFNSVYKSDSDGSGTGGGGGNKFTIAPLGNFLTNDNQTKGAGGNSGSFMPNYLQSSPLTMDKNLFNIDAMSKRQPEEGGEGGSKSNVATIAPGQTMKSYFENRRGDAAKEAAKERAAATAQLAQRNAESMNALIGKVKANNAEVARNVAQAHATISSLINNAAGGGNAIDTAGKIMQGTASNLAQPSFSRA